MIKELQKRGMDAPPAIKREEGMTREQLIALGRERDTLLKEKKEKWRRVEEREEMARLKAMEEGRLAALRNQAGDVGCEKKRPGERKHRLTDEIMEALGSFCFLPLCPESRHAFLRQVHVPDLVGLLSMPEDSIDGGPDALDSPHELGIRCLSKLLAGCERTRDLDKVMAKVECDKERLGPAVSNCFLSENAEVRRIALEIVGLFQDEEWGEFVMRHGLAHATMKLLVEDGDAGVVSAAKASMRSVTMSDAGLGAVFSGRSLEIVQEALAADGITSMRMAEALLRMGRERPECMETCQAMGIKEAIEAAIQSDDECVCLNALELAYMLPLSELSPELVRLHISRILSLKLTLPCTQSLSTHTLWTHLSRSLASCSLHHFCPQRGVPHSVGICVAGGECRSFPACPWMAAIALLFSPAHSRSCVSRMVPGALRMVEPLPCLTHCRCGGCWGRLSCRGSC